MNGWRPSKQIEDLLMGRVPWDDAQPGIRSCASKHIYDAAKQIIAAPDKGTRRNMLGRIPAAIRPKVEAEAKRLWAMRGVSDG